ncbi:M48 family metalloprotease [Acidiferrimicrobium sp. IK]|uniref:M48 family metalloprotease n=1 Tax=Acidiferrimicrobium sp. IK TaxID=2871700 RepID=UPI0021CB1476|nr:M48 family metalloprotease [Acidiferrimicrobium sp. IK]MCU4183209.1 M48 family metalloprotease [Acidiferrimicrobium sp. IK]
MLINRVKTAAILAVLGALFILIGGAIGRGPGLVIGLLLGLAVTGGSYWFSDTVAIKASRAQPVTEAQMPEYYAIVRELCQRGGWPMPRLYVTPDQQPNAFATGRNPEHAAVAVTAGILQIVSWDELRGVLAHEMSHVGNRDILISSVAAAVAMAITFLARMAAFASLFGGERQDEGQNVFETLALIILAPLAAALLQMALSRSREFDADLSGARLIGDGEPLARALEKLDRAAGQIPMPTARPEMAGMYIVNPLRRRQVNFAKWFADHPPTAERVARLRSREWARS